MLAVHGVSPEWVIVAIGGVCDGKGVCMTIKGSPSRVDVEGVSGALEVPLERPFEEGRFTGPRLLEGCRLNVVASIRRVQPAGLECPFVCYLLPFQFFVSRSPDKNVK